MAADSSDRAATASRPEDLFAGLFAAAFGLEKALRRVAQYPFQDVYGTGRFIDYALKAPDDKVAIEVDGIQHLPLPEHVRAWEDDLLRQNSLVHQGWRVFRWTDRQIAEEPETVKEELALFLEGIPGLLAFDDGGLGRKEAWKRQRRQRRRGQPKLSPGPSLRGQHSLW